MNHPIERFDRWATHLIGRLPRRLHRPFDVLGRVTLPSMWALALAIYCILTYNGALLTPGIVTLLVLPLATLSKFLFARKRPPTMYADNMRIKSYSFPSSHAYAAALGSGFFAVSFWGGLASIVSALFVALAITVGVSRVHLGAHYPSDVIGGWLLGAIATIVITCSF